MKILCAISSVGEESGNSSTYIRDKYKKDVSVILDAYYSVLKEVILTGYEISIPGIGVFANKQIEAKPEREKMNYFTKEYYTLPAQDAFNKPTFKFRPALSKAMKERTLGKVF